MSKQDEKILRDISYNHANCNILLASLYLKEGLEYCDRYNIDIKEFLVLLHKEESKIKLN